MNDKNEISTTIPPECSLEDVKIRIRQTHGNPNIGKTHQVELKNGPRTYRIATIFEILDPNKGELHHLSLQLDSFDKIKAGWKTKPDKRIRLEGKDPDEIEALSRFLNTALSDTYPHNSGAYHIVSDSQYQLTEILTDALPKLPGSEKLNLLKVLFNSLDSLITDPKELIKSFQDITPEAVQNIGVACRFVEYKRAFSEFKLQIEQGGVNEDVYQKYLQKHPWLFGSEYSELLDRRSWTRDDNLDFMLRRTADGYLEIVEIKTPFTEELMRHDRNHDSYFPSSKLSQSLGQVLRYIEEVERNRDSIIALDKVDPFKIRAKIIIGRDHDSNHQAALRSFNSHLNRVEIITYDQLLRIGSRILEIFEAHVNKEHHESGFDDDIPF